jgi:tetratricopeptide (TPR) repeat protein
MLYFLVKKHIRKSRTKKSNSLIILFLFALILISCDTELDKKGRYLLKGNEKFKSNDFKGAIDFYSEAIKIDENYKDAFINRALVFQKLNKLDAAIQDYTRILESDPTDSLILFQRGLALLDNGENYKGLNDANALLNLSSVNWQAFLLQGLSFEKLKEYPQAIAAFSKGIEINEANADLLTNLGTIYYYQKNYTKAEELLSKAAEINPKEGNIYNVKSLIAFENNDFDQALKWVNIAIEINAENPFYYNNKGLYLIYLNQLDPAIENINFSIKLFPKNDYALRNKGIYYYYKKDFESAFKYLNDVYNKQPNMDLVIDYLEKIKKER